MTMKKGSSGHFMAVSYQLDDRIDGFQIWTVSYPELERESTCQKDLVQAHLNNFTEFHASAEGVP